jgi:hypothetical protein
MSDWLGYAVAVSAGILTTMLLGQLPLEPLQRASA